jgi:predicted O-methyltransferase YrrM
VIGQVARKFQNEVRSPSDGLTFITRLAVPVDPRARELHSWIWGKLPRVDLESVLPGAELADVTIQKALKRTTGMSLNLEELINLVAIAVATDSRRLVEVGTWDGNTALNLAANIAADGKVITIDLPPDFEGDLALDTPDRFSNITANAARIVQYRDTPYEGKVQQVYGDSAVLDWSEFVSEPLDLAFIDGCHFRAYVEKDTENALRHLKPDGIVVWHDYGYFKDVTDYVDELAERMPVHAIAGTRLAFARPNAGRK